MLKEVSKWFLKKENQYASVGLNSNREVMMKENTPAGQSIREPKNVWALMAEMKNLLDQVPAGSESGKLKEQLVKITDELNYTLRLLTWHQYQMDKKSTQAMAMMYPPQNSECENGPVLFPPINMLAMHDFDAQIQPKL